MSRDFTFSIKSINFDEDYRPSDNTRITTNFANLARGTSRQENLRNTFRMIDNRFNALAHWDNPKGDRYTVELEIISVELNIDGETSGNALPLIEILKTNIVDRKTGERIDGIVGIIFPPTCGIMTSAYCCWSTTRIRPSSARRKISAICTASFSGFCEFQHTRNISRSRPSSA